MREIKDKKVTVVGLARSGTGSANLLSELGAHVTVTDLKTEGDLKEFVARLTPSVRLVLGSHPEDIFLRADLVIVSPGVPLNIQPLLHARSKGIPIMGELELAYQIAMYGSDNPPVPSLIPRYPTLEKGGSGDLKSDGKGGFLAVTGTNGKSTTTALLDFMMKKGGFKTILGGNIGNALTEEILKIVKGQKSAAGGQETYDCIVAEVSSFQLESVQDFRPKVAAIINITPDHLDRYHSFEEYGYTKARMFENQREGDFLVLNRDDPGTTKVGREKLSAQGGRPRIFSFSRREEVEGLYFKGGIIYCNLPESSLPHGPFPLIGAEEIKIKGVHNLENAMAASAMALLAGCPSEAVIHSLKEFPGLEHRLEFVRELEGVSYFNDSKGTNVGAVMKSLESFSGPVILIAGGRDKAGDFSQLKDLVREKVKTLTLIGEASIKIRKALGDLTDTVMAKDLREAVEVARSKAAKGDVVLLSPACASFDMFRDFEDRGKKFKKIVRELE